MYSTPQYYFVFVKENELLFCGPHMFIRYDFIYFDFFDTILCYIIYDLYFTKLLRSYMDNIYVNFKTYNMYKLKLISFNFFLSLFILNVINFVYQLLNIIL